ncbi:hypothetical protein AB0K16_54145 [Nonomuraea jabiensis]|uniref:hypothetical protein n=1 Tax=Nonomuraea jabiensis TaxID=882448 RepID=UPI003447AFBF
MKVQSVARLNASPPPGIPARAYAPWGREQVVPVVDTLPAPFLLVGGPAFLGDVVWR